MLFAIKTPPVSLTVPIVEVIVAIIAIIVIIDRIDMSAIIFCIVELPCLWVILIKLLAIAVPPPLMSIRMEDFLCVS